MRESGQQSSCLISEVPFVLATRQGVAQPLFGGGVSASRSSNRTAYLPFGSPSSPWRLIYRRGGASVQSTATNRVTQVHTLAMNYYLGG